MGADGTHVKNVSALQASGEMNNNDSWACARFARRASRESDGSNGSVPGVALSESGNPGLIASTPLGSQNAGLRSSIQRRSTETPLRRMVAKSKISQCSQWSKWSLGQVRSAECRMRNAKSKVQFPKWFRVSSFKCDIRHTVDELAELTTLRV